MALRVQATPAAHGHVPELTEQQAWDLFDRMADYVMGMTGEEFLRKIDSGEISEFDADPRVSTMRMYLPLIRASR